MGTDGLLKALRHNFRGEVSTDPRQLAIYATDASLFSVLPLAVAWPADEADVAVLVEAAGGAGIPLIARGAGTRRAGGALGAGVIVDFRRHMHGVLEVGEDFARVQPGLTLVELAGVLAGRGQRVSRLDDTPPSGTVGGWVATDSNTASRVVSAPGLPAFLGCRLALDRGDIAALPAEPSNGNRRWQAIAASLPSSCFPLESLAGSEGTLGLFTELNLRTVPLPVGRAAALFAFESFEAAAETALHSLTGQPTECIVFDRRSLSFFRRHSPAWERLLSDDCGALLLANWESADALGAREAALASSDAADGRIPQPLWIFQALDGAALNRFDHLRAEAARSASATPRGPRPLSIVDGISVPPESIAEFVGAVQSIMTDLDCTATLEIRPVVGQVDFRPILDFARDDERAKLWPLADRLYGRVLEMGGTITGRHGIGLARTPWIERHAGGNYAGLQEIKRAFDPHNRFNPGKIVGLDPTRPAWPLRSILAAREPKLPITLPIAADCHGCGDCKTAAAGERMCPPHRVLKTEESSPRGMANALQRLLALPDDSTAEGRELRDIARPCIQCEQCGTGCPASVDVPRLMLETRIAAVRENGLTRAEWFAGRADRWLRWGRRMPGLSNRLLAAAPARRVLQWLTGLARDIRFGPIPHSKYPRTRHRPAEGPVQVLLWIGSAAAAFGAALVEAALQVLRHNGISVGLPAPAILSVAVPLFQGDLNRARRLLKPHLPLLAETVRGGGRIVCLEPMDATAAQRYGDLLFPDEPERNRIAANTFELTDYLNGLHRAGHLSAGATDGNAIAYHMPCHRRRGVGPQPPLWLSEGSASRFGDLDAGCSGMAGTFGLLHANRRVARAISEPLRLALNRPGEFLSVSECSACRLQMRQFSGRPAVHPVEILARSYAAEERLP